MSATIAESTDVETRAKNGLQLSNVIQQLFVFGALIVVYVFFMFFASGFAAPTILPDILLRAAPIGVMALGATFVIATGGIDLSVGTGLSFAAVMTAFFLGGDFLNLPLGLGLLGAILMGALMGAINGFNISMLGLPPFIATLGMMLVARGMALVISNTYPMQIQNPDFKWLSRGEVLPAVPNAAIIFLVLAAIAAVLLNKTLLGRYALAIGSNEEATRLSGINVKLWKSLIYITAGVFMAAGAILYAARSGVVQPAEGLGMELNVIAAVVIGGTSLAGGRANIVGTVVGALLMQTLITGLQMMQVNQSWQFVVTGVIVLVAVFADNVRRARAAAV
ncbi:MAG: ABC transporter permease [Propionibacteriaceae bacterium]|nr:ABC transporter permease [Propionibacteriaceae bacterium]